MVRLQRQALDAQAAGAVLHELRDLLLPVDERVSGARVRRVFLDAHRDSAHLAVARRAGVSFTPAALCVSRDDVPHEFQEVAADAPVQLKWEPDNICSPLPSIWCA